ncbi:MAG: hypothetical protein ACYDHN_03570 [Solirubrobacteraceae bacterium]
MSTRIEHTDPLALLHELPACWAQTCLAYPARQDLTAASAVLSESIRVLRDDGTLWLLLAHPARHILDVLKWEGLRLQPTPRWGAPLTTPGLSGVRLYLLSKGRRYFYDTPRLAPSRRSSACRATSRLTARAEACFQPDGRLLQMLRRCVLAGSSPVACATCGTPFQREADGIQRRASCAHRNPTGRSLVLDPFCRPEIGAAAVTQALGRNYLGAANMAMRSVAA